MKIIYLITIISLSLLISCAAEDRVPTNEAQSQLYAAAKFAADRCGTPIPEPYFLILNEPIRRNLDLCTISITRTGCPFSGYPLPCALIYLENDPGDLPWYLNFNELSKQQIK